MAFPLTLVEVLVSVARLHVDTELVPQAMQLPLDGIKARHGRLEEARLDDANVDSKVVDVPPNRHIKNTRSTAEGLKIHSL